MYCVSSPWAYSCCGSSKCTSASVLPGLYIRVSIDRNVFFFLGGGGNWLGEVHPIDRGLGFLPLLQENVCVPLSKHIYLSVFTGMQELSLCHLF